MNTTEPAHVHSLRGILASTDSTPISAFARWRRTSRQRQQTWCRNLRTYTRHDAASRCEVTTTDEELQFPGCVVRSLTSFWISPCRPTRNPSDAAKSWSSIFCIPVPSTSQSPACPMFQSPSLAERLNPWTADMLNMCNLSKTLQRPLFRKHEEPPNRLLFRSAALHI